MNREEVTDLIVTQKVKKKLTWAKLAESSATARNGAPPPCSAR
jgi:hypothetical protein